MMIAQGISLVLLGVVAASSMAFLNKWKLKIWKDKIVPVQGYIGLAFCFWGVYSLFSQGFLEIEQLHVATVQWTVILVVNFMQIGIGNLLGYSLVSKHVYFGNGETSHRGDQLLLKLARIQQKVGVVGVLIGMTSILLGIIF